MLELAAGGCAVEVHLNGMPVATLGPAGGSVSLAVHEYTLAGRNELTLVVGPAAAGRPARRASLASRSVRPGRGRGWCSSARASRRPIPVRASSAWPNGRRPRAAPTTRPRRTSARSTCRSTSRAGAGSMRRRSSIGAPVKRLLLEFLQQLGGRARPRQSRAADRRREAALRRAGGRLSERRRAAEVQRFRDHVQGLYAAKALKVLPPVADELVSAAAGRMDG